jgi:hypothetical protein
MRKPTPKATVKEPEVVTAWRQHIVDDPLRSASALAAKASELVGGDREHQHGAKQRNFENIATLWQAWLDILATKQSKPSTTLSPHDIGIMMVLMKAARTQTGQTNLDDYIDMAGYAACAGEIIQND